MKKNFVDQPISLSFKVIGLMLENKAISAIIIGGAFMLKDYINPEGVNFALTHLTNKESAAQVLNCAVENKSINFADMKKCTAKVANEN